MRVRTGNGSMSRGPMAAVIFSFALLTGCASTLPAPPKQLPPDDSLIVPGKRIGPVAIGMTSKQVLEAKGSPHASVRFKDAALYNYGDKSDYGVLVDDDTQQVWRVQTTSDSYDTEEGIHVGQTELEMQASLGKPDNSTHDDNDEPVYQYCYDRGLAVYITQGKIFMLSVFNPGGVCQ
ncbi:MAG TPA: hypothetical protein VLV87_09080 [Gammaproteobacteria bacterium]|nr:hypothetical protein [Gammaproteobacteria bacterium]